MQLKVGMRVSGECVDGDNYTGTVERIHENGLSAGVRRDDLKQGGFRGGLWKIDYTNGLWGASCISGKLTILSDWTNNKPQPMTVHGHIPRLIIRIGCKEIEAKDLMRKCRRALTIARIKDCVPFVTTEYTAQDVEDFMAWLKKNRLEKR